MGKVRDGLDILEKQQKVGFKQCIYLPLLLQDLIQ